MRIAIVTPGFSSSGDDWCIPLLQDIAVGLSSVHDVQVYATCYPGVTRDYRVKGVPVRAFGNGRAGRLALCRRQYRTLRAICADHAESPFDVVHGYWADGGGVVAAQFKRRCQVPAMVTVMAGELTLDSKSGYGKYDRPVAGRLARYGAKRADILLALSRFQQRMIVARNKSLAPRVLACGTTLGRFSAGEPSRRLHGDIPVMTAASLIPVKGLQGLIRSFAAAQREHPGLHLHLVGEGPLNADLRKLAAEVGASATFHGHVEHHELPGYYRGARFCVLNSWFESHGMVVVEAAACDRVTIGAAVGSMADYCPEGYLCTPGDDKALTAAIVAATANVDNLHVRRAACSVQDTVSDLVKLYQALAPSRIK